MTKKTMALRNFALAAFSIALGAGPWMLARTPAAQNAASEKVPVFEPDTAGLAAAASQFFCRSAQELRVAIKAIFHANFKFPIDEPPFAEITAEGCLRARPV